MIDRTVSLEQHRNDNGGYIIIDEVIDSRYYYPLDRKAQVDKYLRNSVIIDKITFDNGFIVTVI